VQALAEVRSQRVQPFLLTTMRLQARHEGGDIRTLPSGQEGRRFGKPHAFGPHHGVERIAVGLTAETVIAYLSVSGEIAGEGWLVILTPPRARSGPAQRERLPSPLYAWRSPPDALT
jgi:hypothetical protein